MLVQIMQHNVHLKESQYQLCECSKINYFTEYYSIQAKRKIISVNSNGTWYFSKYSSINPEVFVKCIINVLFFIFSKSKKPSVLPEYREFLL